MKTFQHIRESKMPAGKHVWSKRMNRVQVMIHKDRDGYTVYLDGDKLDSYRSEQEAKNMAKEFISQM